MRDLRRGGEWTTAALLFAFVCWGIWAISNGGSMTTPIIVFALSVVVAAGLFALSRLIGRIVLERAENEVPASLAAAGTSVIPFQAGETMAWLFAGPAVT